MAAKKAIWASIMFLEISLLVRKVCQQTFSSAHFNCEAWHLKMGFVPSTMYLYMHLLAQILNQTSTTLKGKQRIVNYLHWENRQFSSVQRIKTNNITLHGLKSSNFWESQPSNQEILMNTRKWPNEPITEQEAGTRKRSRVKMGFTCTS